MAQAPILPTEEQAPAQQPQEMPQLEHSTEEDQDIQMTPFAPIEVTGKRKRSISPPRTRSGRAVTKHDYKRLHAGTANTILPDPTDYPESQRRPERKHWREACIYEWKGLESSGTLRQMHRKDLPKGRKLLTGKWVFKTKRRPDGSVEKYKARWTARGFTQRHGEDFTTTFAPTPRPATAKTLIALATQYSRHRKQIDVEQAFLNPKLDEQIYIKPPQGMENLLGFTKDTVIKVEKGLYGLKQAANLWYYDASDTMTKLDLKRTSSDACLFTGKGVIVLVHVDDFQIFSPSEQKINEFIKGMSTKYSIKVVESNVFLGIQIINQGPNTTKLSQEHYALEKLRGHQLDNCKPISRPFEHMHTPNECQCTKEDHKVFNQMIGELQYLSNHTRPDITHAVNHLARFLQNPSSGHVTAAKRIWRYIKGTIDHGPTYQKQQDHLQIEAYSDSDFTGDPDTSKSTSGALIRMTNGPILWRSRLQREVVLSSTEAEYLALTETTREMSWLKNLLTELQNFTNFKAQKMKILVNNQSAISLTKDHTNSKRSKHVSLRNHYCREQYEKGDIDVEFVSTKSQQADPLTKAVSPNLHQLLNQKSTETCLSPNQASKTHEKVAPSLSKQHRKFHGTATPSYGKPTKEHETEAPPSRKFTNSRGTETPLKKKSSHFSKSYLPKKKKSAIPAAAALTSGWNPLILQ